MLDGTTPCASDQLKRWLRNGARTSAFVLSSEVGRGSDRDCLSVHHHHYHHHLHEKSLLWCTGVRYLRIPLQYGESTRKRGRNARVKRKWLRPRISITVTSTNITTSIRVYNSVQQMSSYMQQLACCLINAQPLLAHSPAADDNSLIGCTSHDLTDDWLLASTHFVDSWCPFQCSFGCVFYWTRCFENNMSFDSTKPIYLINLLWKLGLEI